MSPLEPLPQQPPSAVHVSGTPLDGRALQDEPPCAIRHDCRPPVDGPPEPLLTTPPSVLVRDAADGRHRSGTCPLRKRASTDESFFSVRSAFADPAVGDGGEADAEAWFEPLACENAAPPEPETDAAVAVLGRTDPPRKSLSSQSLFGTSPASSSTMFSAASHEDFVPSPAPSPVSTEFSGEPTNGRVQGLQAELTASVVSSRTIRDVNQHHGKKYTEYEILITYGAKQWNVQRRYNDFHRLQSILDDCHRSFCKRLPQFPPKRLIGSNFAKEFVLARQQRLDAWLLAVVQEPVLLVNDHTRLFFGFSPLAEGTRESDCAFGWSSRGSRCNVCGRKATRKHWGEEDDSGLRQGSNNSRKSTLSATRVLAGVRHVARKATHRKKYCSCPAEVPADMAGGESPSRSPKSPVAPRNIQLALATPTAWKRDSLETLSPDDSSVAFTAPAEPSPVLTSQIANSYPVAWTPTVRRAGRSSSLPRPQIPLPWSDAAPAAVVGVPALACSSKLAPPPLSQPDSCSSASSLRRILQAHSSSARQPLPDQAIANQTSAESLSERCRNCTWSRAEELLRECTECKRSRKMTKKALRSRELADVHDVTPITPALDSADQYHSLAHVLGPPSFHEEKRRKKEDAWQESEEQIQKKKKKKKKKKKRNKLSKAETRSDGEDDPGTEGGQGRKKNTKKKRRKTIAAALRRHTSSASYLFLHHRHHHVGTGGEESGKRKGKKREDGVPKFVKSVGLKDFTLLRVIGKGSYGKVLLARHKGTDEIVAIKVLNKRVLREKPNEIQRVMSERNVLKQSGSHPFLVGLRYSFQTKHKLYLVIDYVNGGELFFHLAREHRFPEPRARFYAVEIAVALEHLHSRNLVYRDLKPENCLLDAQGHVRLVDFGLTKELVGKTKNAKRKGLQMVDEDMEHHHRSYPTSAEKMEVDALAIEEPTTNTLCGTPEYLAPEMLRCEPYSFAIDWYCLGAVLYEMLVGLPPFYSADPSDMYDRILHERLRFPPDVSPTARSFILSLLERDPARRLGSGPNGSQDVKNHPFFEGVDWGKVVRREYRPPFNPGVVGDLDLRNIDPIFASEPIPASLLAEARDVGVHSSSAIAAADDVGIMPLGFSARSAGASSSSHDSLFKGFSFTTPDVEEFEGDLRESVPGAEAERAEDEDPPSAATTGSGSEEEATDDDDEEEEEEDDEEDEDDEDDEEDDDEDEEEGEGVEDEDEDEESDAVERTEEENEEDCPKPPAASSAAPRASGVHAASVGTFAQGRN